MTDLDERVTETLLPEAAAIGFGSNRGERERQLAVGLRGVRRVVDVVAVSSVYETEPVHFANQSRFLNAACIGRTRHGPRELLAALQEVERAAGRTRHEGSRYGPRVLDLDLLLYGNVVIDLPDLVVPHPRMRERAFVLIPLRDIAPDWWVPASHGRPGASVGELAEAVSTEGVTATPLRLEDA